MVRFQCTVVLCAKQRDLGLNLVSGGMVTSYGTLLLSKCSHQRHQLLPWQAAYTLVLLSIIGLEDEFQFRSRELGYVYKRLQ